MDDDDLKSMSAELRANAREAGDRNISLFDIRMLIDTLRRRGFGVEVVQGAARYQLTIGIDLGGDGAVVFHHRDEDAPTEDPAAEPEPKPESDLVPGLKPVPDAPQGSADEAEQEPAEADQPAPQDPHAMPVLAPVPKRATQDPPRAQETKEQKSGPVSGPLSEAEIDIIVVMTREGWSYREIAQRLNCAAPRVYNWKRNNPERLDQADDAPEPLPPEIAGSSRMIEAHLNAVGHEGGWTPKRDLRMVLMIGRGDKADRVAADLRVSPNEVLARWRTINSAPGDLKHQTNLVAVLKRRAGE